ncbi:zinc finger protein, partial [Elysia marginata]
MGLFHCEECPAVFSLRRNLNRHIRVKHRGGDVRFTCDDCGATFSRLDNLTCHIRERHTEVVPNFLCERCGLGFSQKNFLTRHRCDAVSLRKDRRKRKNERKGERVHKRRRCNNELLEPYRPDITEDDLEGEGVDNIISLIEEDG